MPKHVYSCTNTCTSCAYLYGPDAESFVQNKKLMNVKKLEIGSRGFQNLKIHRTKQKEEKQRRKRSEKYRVNKNTEHSILS